MAIAQPAASFPASRRGLDSCPAGNEQGLKDVMLAVDAVADARAHLPCAPVLRETFETTVSEVGNDLEWVAVAEFTRRRSVP